MILYYIILVVQYFSSSKRASSSIGRERVIARVDLSMRSLRFRLCTQMLASVSALKLHKRPQSGSARLCARPCVRASTACSIDRWLCVCACLCAYVCVCVCVRESVARVKSTAASCPYGGAAVANHVKATDPASKGAKHTHTQISLARLLACMRRKCMLTFFSSLAFLLHCCPSISAVTNGDGRTILRRRRRRRRRL